MNYYLSALKSYYRTAGRASRKDYWMFILFNIIFAVLFAFLDVMLKTTFNLNGTSIGYGYLYTAYTLFTLLPGLTLAVKRMHDLDKSGWFLSVAFIPVAGFVWLLVLLCSKGTVGSNKYGSAASTVN